MQTPLTRVGQVKNDDLLWFSVKGAKFAYRVKSILHPGKSNEEILLDKKKNIYFVTSRAIDGTSWLEDVRVVILWETEQ